jgi:Predicted transcriptional regulators
LIITQKFCSRKFVCKTGTSGGEFFYLILLKKVLYLYRIELKGCDNLDIKVGELIRAKREEKNLSPASFANKLGISRAYLSQLENGREANHKLETILKISKELDLDVGLLLGQDSNVDMTGLKIPSLLKLVFAKDRNNKVLEDREVQKKISSILDKALESKYLIENNELYALFLEDIYIQIETTLKRYMAIQILMHNTD